MPKTPKIDVLTVKLTVHIPVDPGEPDTVVSAGLAAKAASVRARGERPRRRRPGHPGSAPPHCKGRDGRRGVTS